MNTIKIYTLLEYMLIVSVNTQDYSSVPKKHKWVLGELGGANKRVSTQDLEINITRSLRKSTLVGGAQYKSQYYNKGRCRI